jgi:uncharacterized protein (DUF427 family)
METEIGKSRIRITHKPSGEVIAEGETGWGMFAFEGNYYISNKNFRTKGFKMSWTPGICPYKFLYFWYHFKPQKGEASAMIAWKYWLPNPLFPFIAFRMAVPSQHQDLIIEKF